MNMRGNDPEREFAAAAKARFDESVERLDAATRSALHRKRQEALAGTGAGIAPAWRRWVPAAGLAAAIAMTAVMLRMPELDGTVPVPAAAEGDLEILLGGDSLEMYEDLEFYVWMEQQGAEAGNDTG